MYAQHNSNTNNIYQNISFRNRYQNTPYLCPEYQVPNNLRQFAPLHPSTSGLTLINVERAPSRRSGENGHFYCGRYNMYNVPNCDGYCGPTNGPHCQACNRAEDLVIRGIAVLNLDQVYSVYSLESHKFYCNRSILQNIPNCDGFCGPTNGPNCAACQGLDELKRLGYIQIDDASGVISHYSFSANHFYCGRPVMQVTQYNDQFCGPTNGPQCNICASIEQRIKTIRQQDDRFTPQPVNLVQQFDNIFNQVVQLNQNWLQQKLSQTGYNPQWVEADTRNFLLSQLQQECLIQRVPFNDTEFIRLFNNWFNTYRYRYL